MSATRDFELIEQSDVIAGTVEKYAMATLSVMKPKSLKRDTARVALSRECIERFVALSLTLQVAMMDYQPSMSEDQLRAWAAQLHKDVTG